MLNPLDVSRSFCQNMFITFLCCCATFVTYKYPEVVEFVWYSNDGEESLVFLQPSRGNQGLERVMDLPGITYEPQPKKKHTASEPILDQHTCNVGILLFP